MMDGVTNSMLVSSLTLPPPFLPNRCSHVLPISCYNQQIAFLLANFKKVGKNPKDVVSCNGRLREAIIVNGEPIWLNNSSLFDIDGHNSWH